MKNTLIAGFFVSGIVLAAGLAYAQPEWASDLGIDVWNLPDLHSELDEARQRRGDLEQQSTATTKRMNAKQAILDELLDQRITFREAAIRINRLNRGTVVVQGLRLRYPNLTDDEACCRNLIVLAVCDPSAGSLVDEFCVKFESALEEMRLEGGGEVHLPE